MRRHLFPAVVGDILDTLGCLRQFLPPGIRPVAPNMVVVGRAMPVLEALCFAAVEEEGKLPLSRQPFGLLFESAGRPAPERGLRRHRLRAAVRRCGAA